MGGSPICFSRNRSPAPTWSLNYNCQIITSSYKHVLWKLMRCLHKNIFTTCLWTFWEVLSWMLQLGSLCEKLPPAPARCAGPAPCWQRHWPSNKGDHLLPRPEMSTGKGKVTGNSFSWRGEDLPHCSPETQPLLQFPGRKTSGHVKSGWPS